MCACIQAAYLTSTKMPHASINLASLPAKGSSPGSSCIAEIASMQLEMNSLSYHTGEAKYANAAMGAMKAANNTRVIICAPNDKHA